MILQTFGATLSAAPDFLLLGPGHRMAFSGVARHLPAGGVATLAERAAQFFATADQAEPGRDAAAGGAAAGEDCRILVGAVPYGTSAADHLFQPLHRLAPVAGAQPRMVRPTALKATTKPAVRVQAEPSAAQYRAAVAEALARIGQGRFEKIVLSRSLRLIAQQPHDPVALLERLSRDPLVTVFSAPLPALPTAPARRLIGATPELLVERRGDQVFSHPLAGSTPRRADALADREAGAQLLASPKNQREHRAAAEMVLDTLAPYCRKLSAPLGMALTSTAGMWHLGTRIEGLLRDRDTPCAELLAVLHPTPAVCGLPRAIAEAALPELEGYDRGFYAGAVGWLDDRGDGAWYLALRCAEVSDCEARLYAGAGIVAGSTPEAEAAETSAKFRAMLSAFGVDESGIALEEMN